MEIGFLHKSRSNRWFRNEIHSLLSLADARGSVFTILSFIACDACRYSSLLYRSGIVIDVKKVGHTENI